jgi:ASC-1-like (ASCH) protein
MQSTSILTPTPTPTKANRLFLPLKSNAFDWFNRESKKYELRRLRNQYTQKYVKKGRLVELRCGYSGKSIWGQIGQVSVYNSLHQIFSTVNFEDIIPIASSVDHAIDIAAEFVGNEGPYILFEISKRGFRNE